MATDKLVLEDKHGEMVVVPSRLAICDNCHGEGKVENPAFSNGFTGSEWDEMEDESRDRYMSGAYDVACPCCNARGLRRIADVARMTFAQKRVVAYARISERDDRAYQRECDAERRQMGYN